MDVREVNAEGLRREFAVTVPAQVIEDRVQERLRSLGARVRIPGFRPGKVPLPLLRKRYGPSVLGEVLEDTVNSSSREAISERELRPALQPKIEITSFEEGGDLEYKMAVEVLPEIPAVDFSALELTRLKAEVPDETVDKALQNLAEQQTRHEPIPEARGARPGDLLVLDFEGRIGGEPFAGGSATDFRYKLGSGGILPPFDERLEGAEPGGRVEVEVEFPQDYGNPEVAGKTAAFDVAVKEIREPQPVAIDDELAKAYGFESVAQLRDEVRKRIEQDYARLSRARLKRALLDALAERYRFEVPKGLVDLEFDSIWAQLRREMEQTGTDFEKLGKSEEELREEYRGIAERRVRLGLLLTEVGRRNDIKVEPDELSRRILEEARRFPPGQERQRFLEFVQKNPQIAEQVRAPLFEDKVCDFIIEMARVEERQASPEELARDPDAEEQGEAAAPATAS